MATAKHIKNANSKGRGILFGLAYFIVIALLLLNVAMRLAIHLLPEYTDEIQGFVEDKLDIQLQVDSVTGRVDGFFPVLELQDLQVQIDKESQPLTIKQASVALHPWLSLLKQDVQLEHLHLSGAEAELEVNENGGIKLKGQADKAQQEFTEEKVRKLLDVVYQQRNITLDSLAVSFDLPDMPDIKTEDLAIKLSRRGQKRTLAVSFGASNQPIAADVLVQLDQPVYRFSELAGNIYLAVKGEELERWVPKKWPLDYVPTKVTGQVHAWGSLTKGGLADTTIQLDNGQFRLTHKKQDDYWALNQASLLANAKRTQDGYELVIEEAKGQSEKAGDFKLGPLWIDAKGDGKFADYHWDLYGQDISISRLVRHLKAWPFDVPEALTLALDTAPKGEISSFQFAGKGKSWHSVSAEFTDLALGTDEHQASFSGASGWLAGTHDKGVISLNARPLTLQFPKAFNNELSAAVDTDVVWQSHEDEWRFTTGLVSIENADAQGKALAELRLVKDEDPYLKLRGEVTDGNVKSAKKYIPLLLLPPKVSEWLETAFIGGKLERGRFLYEGTVKPDKDMPWQRTFLMSFQTENAELNVSPDWPHFKNINGKVQINGGEVQGSGLAAHYLGQQISDIDVLVEPAPNKTTLLASGDFQGPANSLNKLFNDTGIAHLIPDELKKWKLDEGELNGSVDLRLPLGKEAKPVNVDVTSNFNGASFASEDMGISVKKLTGNAVFSSDSGLQVDSFTGELFDSPITGNVTSRANNTQVAFAGQAGIDQLKKWQDISNLEVIQGVLDYQFSLNLPRTQDSSLSWQVYSDLERVRVNLPKPLAKQYQQKLPLSVASRSAGKGQRISLRAGDRAQADLLVEGGALSRGGVHLGKGRASLPSSGIRIDGHVDSVDVEEWWQYLRKQFDSKTTGQLPNVYLSLITQRLGLGDAGYVNDATFSLQQSNDGYRAKVKSDRLTGELTMPKGYHPKGDVPLKVNLASLYWPFKKAQLPTKADKIDVSIKDIPRIDAAIESLTLDGKNLGAWSAQLKPYSNGVRAENLEVNWRKQSIDGNLTWKQSDTGLTSHLKADITSKSLAELFAELDLEAFIEGDKATSKWSVKWDGAPWDFDYKKLHGDIYLDVKDAFFPSTDKRTSALRMLGLLNIGNTFKRRLRLDFSDAVKEGLVVDRITGNHQLSGPEMTTTDLLIKAPSAEFKVAGKLDLSKGELDSGIEIILPVSSNLYAGCFAGPAACAGIFVVERLWGDKLEKITSMQYQVKGPWKKPDVKDVRKVYEQKRKQYKR